MYRNRKLNQRTNNSRNFGPGEISELSRFLETSYGLQTLPCFRSFAGTHLSHPTLITKTISIWNLPDILFSWSYSIWHSFSCMHFPENVQVLVHIRTKKMLKQIRFQNQKSLPEKESENTFIFWPTSSKEIPWWLNCPAKMNRRLQQTVFFGSKGKIISHLIAGKSFGIYITISWKYSEPLLTTRHTQPAKSLFALPIGCIIIPGNGWSGNPCSSGKMIRSMRTRW